MEAKIEIIQIETFYEYGKDKELEHVEIRVHIDGEIVHTQRMNPLMYRLDNSPIRHFLSWIKGDRIKKTEDYARRNPSWEITLTEADRELVQKMIDRETKRLREEEKQRRELLKMIEDAKHGKTKGWF